MHASDYCLKLMKERNVVDHNLELEELLNYFLLNLHVRTFHSVMRPSVTLLNDNEGHEFVSPLYC